MAQLHITLDQDEILSLLGQDSGQAFRSLLQESLNAVLQAESTEQLGAEAYERTEGRTDVRNGTRMRQLVTRIGAIELTVPRHRNVPFKTLVFDNYSRSEAALVTTMAEMVVAGVSTAKVGRVMEELCDRNFSRSTVSEACKTLDQLVDEFRCRPLSEPFPFVFLDATFAKVRENHRVRAKAFMIAIGLTRDGKREVLGCKVYDDESYDSWNDFITGLKTRGLHGVYMMTSDSRLAIPSAFARHYPDAAWQRCQAHFMRNICDAAPRNHRIGLRSELTDMFNTTTIEQARRRCQEIVADYQDIAPKAMECLENGFEDAFTVMQLPADMALRRSVRTTNMLERLNGEVRKRTQIVRVYPNTASLERMVGALLAEQHQRWQTNQTRIYYKPVLQALDQCQPHLVDIAHTQQQIRQAA